MTYAPVPPPPTPKKSNTGLIIGIILGVVVLVCVGCGVGVWALGWWAEKKTNEILDQLPTGEALPPAAQAGSHTVRYEVEGSGEALLNWARGTGGQDSENAQLPWTKEIVVNDDNFGLLVSAVPRGKDTTVKSCRILIDGQERKKVEPKSGAAICTFTFVGKP
ncbi:MmpS family transport accessory protein [Allorhizocola rhizosphaerae]|uniref:MmpS family transport accessory protein n=1 Tax=Allorhizocola rhizosphaerae TaxID=1872709 RepID=UPI000E3E1054|nr:MmpS family transport accessory protein [Allorhizocola rhizosphaerae]